MKPKRNVYQFSNFILKKIKSTLFILVPSLKIGFGGIISKKNILKFVNFNTKTALKSTFSFVFLVSNGIFAARRLDF